MGRMPWGPLADSNNDGAEGEFDNLGFKAVGFQGGCLKAAMRNMKDINPTVDSEADELWERNQPPFESAAGKQCSQRRANFPSVQ